MTKEEKGKIGRVIVLNGPSAAGKSTLQKAVQELMPEPYMAVGVDTFFNDILPDKHGRLGREPQGGFEATEVRSVSSVMVKGKEAIALHVGPIGQKAIRGMHRAMRAYALMGNHLVVDYIAYEDGWRKDLLEVLHDIPTTFVKVTLPLEVLEAREQKRSTSPIGHARSHYFHVHQHWTYDVEVDTHALTPHQGALKIIAFMRTATPR